MRLDVVDVEGQLGMSACRTSVVLLEQNLISESFPAFGVVPLPDISIVASAFFLTGMIGTQARAYPLRAARAAGTGMQRRQGHRYGFSVSVGERKEENARVDGVPVLAAWGSTEAEVVADSTSLTMARAICTASTTNRSWSCGEYSSNGKPLKRFPAIRAIVLSHARALTSASGHCLVAGPMAEAFPSRPLRS